MVGRACADVCASSVCPFVCAHLTATSTASGCFLDTSTFIGSPLFPADTDDKAIYLICCETFGGSRMQVGNIAWW